MNAPTIIWISADRWIAAQTAAMAHYFGWSHPRPSDKRCGFTLPELDAPEFSGPVTLRPDAVAPESHRRKAGSTYRRACKFSEAQQAEAVRMIDAGSTWKEATQATGLHAQLISRLLQARKAIAAAASPDSMAKPSPAARPS